MPLAPADFCPLSDRSIQYALLNDPALRHAAKPDSVYANDRASYHDLMDLLSRPWPNTPVQRRRAAQSAAWRCYQPPHQFSVHGVSSWSFCHASLDFPTVRMAFRAKPYPPRRLARSKASHPEQLTVLT